MTEYLVLTLWCCYGFIYLVGIVLVGEVGGGGTYALAVPDGMGCTGRNKRTTIDADKFDCLARAAKLDCWTDQFLCFQKTFPNTGPVRAVVSGFTSAK